MLLGKSLFSALKGDIDRNKQREKIIFQKIHSMSNNHAKFKLLRELKNVGIEEENNS